MIKVSLESELASSLINASQRLPSYKSGGDRFQSRTQVSLKSGSSYWTQQDINTLFKLGNYIFDIPVIGKTADYVVTVEILNFLPLLSRELKTQPFNSNTVQQVIRRAMSINKLKISCSCPDFAYRYSYSLSLAGSKAGNIESRPSVVTNPTYQKGICKHIIAVLSNKSWIPQVATNLHTYILNLFDSNRQLFDSLIRPALGNITDDKILNRITPVQTETTAAEAVNSYYSGTTSYNDEQKLMIAISKELGADVQIYITPENTPEQILELANSYQSGIDPDFLLELSNTSYSPQTIKVLTKAKKCGLDWIRFAHIHPNILNYLLEQHETNNISIDELDIENLSLPQIKQIIKNTRRPKK